MGSSCRLLRSNTTDPTLHNMGNLRRLSLMCAMVVTVLSSTTSGSLRHKSSKLKFTDNRIDAVGSATDTCKRSEPCGWALYLPGSSPRKIYKYTRNIFCSCSGSNVCSLTRDALQQNSFVFYCRPKETSKFRFPGGRKN